MNSFWAICVDYLNSTAVENAGVANLSRSRVDYKTILPPDEFDVFSRLRELRKELAQAETVPVYALFTNEQLAQMVQRRCHSKSDLAAIEGVSDSKIGKYGEESADGATHQQSFPIRATKPRFAISTATKLAKGCSPGFQEPQRANGSPLRLIQPSRNWQIRRRSRCHRRLSARIGWAALMRPQTPGQRSTSLHPGLRADASSADSQISCLT